MIRQQEIRNPLLDPILMPAVPTHHLALRDLRLQQQRVQIPHHLLLLRILRVGCVVGFCGWERREAELLLIFFWLFVSLGDGWMGGWAGE